VVSVPLPTGLPAEGMAGRLLPNPLPTGLPAEGMAGRLFPIP